MGRAHKVMLYAIKWMPIWLGTSTIHRMTGWWQFRVKYDVCKRALLHLIREQSFNPVISVDVLQDVNEILQDLVLE